jgi:hypothetical protein
VTQPPTHMPVGACVDIGGEDYIAGWKTRADWQGLRARLVTGDPKSWVEAFNDYYKHRLDRRYLHPIELMQKHGTFSGEGFAIAAVQCSLIEFLESTEQGINYVHGIPGPHEYSKSGQVFVSFLMNRKPFSAAFTDQASAEDFWAGVRCGLLHEARTKNGWRIWGHALHNQIVDVANRILDRDNFQAALLDYIDDYGVRLPTDAALQAAFIRKFDSL